MAAGSVPMIWPIWATAPVSCTSDMAPSSITGMTTKNIPPRMMSGIQ